MKNIFWQIENSPAFQAVLRALVYRRSLTCGDENKAFQAKKQKLTRIELKINN
ncbi:MAG: hypothetical protein FWG50_02800 [Kiritimatiellaeota bacterium]|nr:hypothetical protein [Kiritimatiellota bacterium]